MKITKEEKLKKRLVDMKEYLAEYNAFLSEDGRVLTLKDKDHAIAPQIIFTYLGLGRVQRYNPKTDEKIEQEVGALSGIVHEWAYLLKCIEIEEERNRHIRKRR